jgi:DNA-binding XRE family transcriptional regulator
MSRVMHWIDQELTKDPKLASRVESELARLRLEQDLVVLREQRGISQRQLARQVRLDLGQALDAAQRGETDPTMPTARKRRICRGDRTQAGHGRGRTFNASSGHRRCCR